MLLKEAKKLLSTNGYRLVEAKRTYSNNQKKNLLRVIFELDEIEETGPGEYEAKEMHEYDVITYFNWQEDDTLKVSFNYIDDVLELTDFSKHFTIEDEDYYVVSKDSVLEEFIDNETDAWQECFEV